MKDRHAQPGDIVGPREEKSTFVLFFRDWAGYTLESPFQFLDDVLPDHEREALRLIAEEWARREPKAMTKQRERALHQEAEREDERKAARRAHRSVPARLAEQDLLEAVGRAAGWFRQKARGEITSGPGAPEPAGKVDHEEPEAAKRWQSGEEPFVAPSGPVLDVTMRSGGHPPVPRAVYFHLTDGIEKARGLCHALSRRSSSTRRFGYQDLRELTLDQVTDIRIAVNSVADRGDGPGGERELLQNVGVIEREFAGRHVEELQAGWLDHRRRREAAAREKPDSLNALVDSVLSNAEPSLRSVTSPMTTTTDGARKSCFAKALASYEWALTQRPELETETRSVVWDYIHESGECPRYDRKLCTAVT